MYSDGPPGVLFGDTEDAGPMFAVIWEVITPAGSPRAGGDPGDSFTPLPNPGVARVLRMVIAPGQAIDAHRTDTLDVVHVAQGAAELMLESGPVPIGTGDFIVLQGDVHGWRNPHDDACVVVGLMLGTPSE